jgi:hypothetical protein
MVRSAPPRGQRVPVVLGNRDLEHVGGQDQELVGARQLPSPIVLGAGTPLFDGSARHQLVQRSVRVSTNATHLVHDVPR